MFSANLISKEAICPAIGKDKPSFSQKGLSAFQILLANILEANGDMEKIPKKFRGALRCSVKETSPNFLLTDGSFFLSAYFTQDSYKQFRKENSSLRVTDLKDIMVQINKWSIELVMNQNAGNSTGLKQLDRSNGPQVFTSYAGLEMKMIIHQMDIKRDFKVELKKYPTNLFRDDKMKSHIAYFLKKQQNLLLEGQRKAWKDDLLYFQKALQNDFNSDKICSTVSTSKPLPFMFSLKPTAIMTVYEFVKQEQGQKGLDELKRKQQAEQIQLQFELPKKAENTAERSKQASQKVVTKKTLKVAKTESKITTTISKKSKTKAPKTAKKRETKAISKKPIKASSKPKMNGADSKMAREFKKFMAHAAKKAKK